MEVGRRPLLDLKEDAAVYRLMWPGSVWNDGFYWTIGVLRVDRNNGIFFFVSTQAFWIIRFSKPPDAKEEFLGQHARQPAPKHPRESDTWFPGLSDSISHRSKPE